MPDESTKPCLLNFEYLSNKFLLGVQFIIRVISLPCINITVLIGLRVTFMQDQMVVLQVYLVSMHTLFLLYSHPDDNSKHILKTTDFIRIATFILLMPFLSWTGN